MKGRNGKIHRQPVTTATKFSNCLIDWLGGGSTLALFAAEFSLELYYTSGQKSLWAKSHLLESGSQWRYKQLRFKPLLDEGLSGRKWLQKSGWLTKRTLFK